MITLNGHAIVHQPFNRRVESIDFRVTDDYHYSHYNDYANYNVSYQSWCYCKVDVKQ